MYPSHGWLRQEMGGGGSRPLDPLVRYVPDWTVDDRSEVEGYIGGHLPPTPSPGRLCTAVKCITADGRRDGVSVNCDVHFTQQVHCTHLTAVAAATSCFVSAVHVLRLQKTSAAPAASREASQRSAHRLGWSGRPRASCVPRSYVYRDRPRLYRAKPSVASCTPFIIGAFFTSRRHKDVSGLTVCRIHVHHC